MNKFIRRMTHDNTKFENQWPDTYDKLHQLFRESNQESDNILVIKKKALNTIVDYIQEEPIASVEPCYSKTIFIKLILNFIADEPQLSLAEVVQNFRRIFDVNNIFNQWHLSCIQTFSNEFRLFEKLSSTKSFDLIKSILESLQKHSFSNGRVNKETEEKWQQYLATQMFSTSHWNTNILNQEETMIAMRSEFQILFR